LKVTVRFFTSLREIVGKKEEIIELKEKEKISIGEILENLAQRHGTDFVQYVYDGKTRNVKSFLQFFINGRSAASLSGMSTEIIDGDLLAIIPPVGGG
jgi:MoaD family protein